MVLLLVLVSSAYGGAEEGSGTGTDSAIYKKGGAPTTRTTPSPPHIPPAPPVVPTTTRVPPTWLPPPTKRTTAPLPTTTPTTAPPPAATSTTKRQTVTQTTPAAKPSSTSPPTRTPPSRMPRTTKPTMTRTTKATTTKPTTTKPTTTKPTTTKPTTTKPTTTKPTTTKPTTKASTTTTPTTTTTKRTTMTKQTTTTKRATTTKRTTTTKRATTTKRTTTKPTTTKRSTTKRSSTRRTTTRRTTTKPTTTKRSTTKRATTKPTTRTPTTASTTTTTAFPGTPSRPGKPPRRFTLICAFEFLTRYVWGPVHQCTDYVYMRMYNYEHHRSGDQRIEFTSKKLENAIGLRIDWDIGDQYRQFFRVADVQARRTYLQFPQADLYMGMWGMTYVRLLESLWTIQEINRSIYEFVRTPIHSYINYTRFEGFAIINSIVRDNRGHHQANETYVLDIIAEFPYWKQLLNQSRVCFSVTTSINYGHITSLPIDFHNELNIDWFNAFRFRRLNFTGINEGNKKLNVEDMDMQYEFENRSQSHMWVHRYPLGIVSVFVYDDATTLAPKIEKLLDAWPHDRCVVFDDIGEDGLEGNFTYLGHTTRFGRFEMFNVVSGAMIKRYGGTAFPDMYHVRVPNVRDGLRNITPYPPYNPGSRT
ncbi:uncharacterized protein LOC142767301 isoform X2 [Rhipicephalus microplus]|uniref:uncharacterized protein LOC142767301 isoform X2 n=1 Tax=Rhipicephalus microplus TaxID=6941 RepID=UPI003F6D022D